MISEEELAEYFASFTSSAFRLETLDTYRVAEEAEYFDRFLSGGDFPEEWRHNPWVRSITSTGRRLRRVRVLTPPLSDYLRFQLSWGYPGNVRDGEEISILNLSDHPVPDLPDHDFWLFDEKTVLRMHYTGTGEFLGAERIDEDLTAEYLGYRDKALAAAVPYTDYWDRVHHDVE
ncbi:hypothetical protein NI17_001805 [Thermobifida halotolerans]|uniref:Uncharacterized protein n=1 Tax=Thermobifida halotolerans TaxID=483545 RepID=A0A399G1Q1_9ACTN|nr:DUF6879 family protein [Thermobifida halotolerans]UOE20014.1 hypothetical protein NI17_001805 [Thermobifida halotolerans]